MFRAGILAILLAAAFPPIAGAQTGTRVASTERVITIREYEEAIKEVQEERKEPLLAAIFIKNRASSVDDQKARVLEDMFIGEVTGVGMRVVSPEDTVTALRRFYRTDEERERRTVDDRSKVEDENRLMSQAVDRMLEDSTSALRLAQMMGVDYVLVASITSYGRETNRINRPDMGIDRTITTHKLRTTYKVLDIAKGGSEAAGNILSERRASNDNTQDGGLVVETMLDDLLANASQQMAGHLGSKIAEGRVRTPDEVGAKLPFTVMCGMQDMSVPEVIKDEQGRYMITGNTYKLEALAVTVELDGVVVGSAPGTLEAYPGLHRLRLTREGFAPWERMVNIAERSDGEPMVLQVAMQLDETGRRRWIEDMERLNRMKRDQALTDAQVDLIKGIAEMFRKTEIRIDPEQIDVNPDRRQQIIWPF